MTSPEELLVASLHHRADQVEAEPTPTSSVAERAGAQQRRARTVTGLAAAAAVAAVVVPLVVVLGDGSDRGDGPLPADRPTVAPSDAGWLGTLPAGPAPAVPWLDRDLYVTGDGTRTALGVDDVRDAVPYRGGFVAIGHGADDGPRVILLDADHEVVWSRCGSPELAVSEDGATVAWFVNDSCPLGPGTLQVNDVEGASPDDFIVREDSSNILTPVGFDGDVIVYGRGGMYAATGLPEGASIDPVPGVGTSGPVLRGGVDPDAGLVAGQARDVLRSPGVVATRVGGARRWTLPDWTLGPFSPDGAHLLAERGPFSPDPGAPAIVDSATGRDLVRIELPDSITVTDYAWEDDTHALLAVVGEDGQAVLRVDLDGAISRASEIAPYDHEAGPRLWLAAGS